MSRTALVSISILLLGAAGLLLSMNGCGGVSNSHSVKLPPNYNLPHVVIIFQENRTPDNLFQGLCLPPNGSSSSCNSTSPSASQYDIASSGTNSTGANIHLRPIDLGTVGANPDMYHGWREPHRDRLRWRISWMRTLVPEPAIHVCESGGRSALPHNG